jgi:hypothetical protein
MPETKPVPEFVVRGFHEPGKGWPPQKGQRWPFWDSTHRRDRVILNTVAADLAAAPHSP